MKFIDNFLNGITMYRLVLYGLMILSAISIVLGFAHVLPYSGLSLIYSFLTLAVFCYFLNYLFAKIFKVQANVESNSITAFILFFILFPLESFSDIKIFFVVCFLAMGSKYILAINKKHIFNPTAIAIFLMGLFGSGVASWWVGSSVMIIPVAVFGFLILRKVQRFQMFFTFLAVSLISVFLVRWAIGTSPYDLLRQVFLSEPLIFFGVIMLTEPLTTPPDKKLRMVYGAIVGALYGAQFSFGPLYSSPELALIIANLFSYIVSPRIRAILTLVEKNQLRADTFEFVWKTDRKFAFKAGQYLEWTLGHSKPDSRGNRRFFTIASSPTEENLRLGIKIYENPSSFKKKLISLNVGDQIVASQLSGEFTLPKDSKQKMVFIAGGIGVTPFRSMIKMLSDTGDKRGVTLFYSNKTPNDIVYKNVFDEAENKIGSKTIYVVNDLAGANLEPNMRTGRIDEGMIKTEVPDYKERQFYISGPHGMVSAFEQTLEKMGVKDIKIDFFPGY